MSVSVLFTSEFEFSPAVEAEWLKALPTERQRRIRSWPERRDRQRSLLASRLLVESLRRLGHARSALATLRYPPRSRPTLDLPLQFSLAHCAGRIACAVSTHGTIGIDVEALAGLGAHDFPLYLNPAERAWAGQCARRFYSVWTRKEAVAKAAGTTGLPALPAVDTTPGERRAAFAGRLWRTEPVAFGSDWVGHVALADLHVPMTVEHLPEEALLLA